MSFLSADEIAAMGFAAVGQDARISRRASFYNAANIHLGDHVRIDDFCVLSAGAGGIFVGRNVHIAVYCSLIGKGAITLQDFVGLSSRVAIYSSNDDYSGAYLTGPTVPPEFTNITAGPVTLCRHAILGSGSVVLPNLTVGEGAAVGALSLVSRDCDSFGVYVGVPARKIKERSRDLLVQEQAYLQGASSVSARVP